MQIIAGYAIFSILKWDKTSSSSWTTKQISIYLFQYELRNFYSYNPRASLQKKGKIKTHTHTSMNNIFDALEGDISHIVQLKKKKTQNRTHYMDPKTNYL